MIHAKSWTKSIRTGKEFSLQPLKILSGKIPKDLSGSLYRNGPGRIERGNKLAGHWYDGDGAVLGVHFLNGNASGVYKYIRSPEFIEEEKQNKYIYGSFSHEDSRGKLSQLLTGQYKNSANTSCLPLDGKVLALYEGGRPWAMDPITLETIGEDNLSGLKGLMSYSAHPKIDPDTGEVFNFGQNPFPSRLFIYRSNKEGKITHKSRIKLQGLNLIHDCVIAGKYLVIMEFPTQINTLPLFLGLKSISKLISWKPELGTKIYIFDRNDLSLVSKVTTDPFWCSHFTNGYEEKDGNIYIEFIKFDSYDEVEMLGKDYIKGARGELTNTPNLSRLSYMRINPTERRVIESRDIDGRRTAEFPSTANHLTGKDWRYTLFVGAPKAEGVLAPGEMYKSIARLDRKGNKLEVNDFGSNRYVNEPILVSSHKDPEHGYILTLVYDADKDESELWIHDTSSFEGDPICRLGIPEVVPMTFHGRFQPLIL